MKVIDISPAGSRVSFFGHIASRFFLGTVSLIMKGLSLGIVAVIALNVISVMNQVQGSFLGEKTWFSKSTQVKTLTRENPLPVREGMSSMGRAQSASAAQPGIQVSRKLDPKDSIRESRYWVSEFEHLVRTLSSFGR